MITECKRAQPGWLVRVKYRPGVYMGLLRQQATTFASKGRTNGETLAQFIERGFVAYDHAYDRDTGERIRAE